MLKVGVSNKKLEQHTQILRHDSRLQITPYLVYFLQD